MKSISVSNLSKVYLIDAANRSGAGFRDLLAHQIFSFFLQKKEQQKFYALQDINFDVEQGEVIGLIGKNGSGKSTLLKVLSRITAPTTGVISLRGRVCSLLEVGTGFHEELTGRENVYMSGIILGMKRSEIDIYFDQIVDFAGVGKFINTPIKQYSSGMRLRLAFSVSAYLQSDILLVDEVLAVGDYEFEKRCMNMMQTVAGEGRTVIFVSHNLAAIRKLCSKSIYLSQGRLIEYGNTSETISRYISSHHTTNSNITEWPGDDAPGNEIIKIRKVEVTAAEYQQDRSSFLASDVIQVSISYEVASSNEMLSIILRFYDEYGVLLFTSIDTSNQEWRLRTRNPGFYKSICTIPPYLFRPGKIFVALHVSTSTQWYRFAVDEIINFVITSPEDMTSIVGDWAWEWPHVAVMPKLTWNINYEKYQ